MVRLLLRRFAIKKTKKVRRIFIFAPIYRKRGAKMLAINEFILGWISPIFWISILLLSFLKARNWIGRILLMIAALGIIGINEIGSREDNGEQRDESFRTAFERLSATPKIDLSEVENYLPAFQKEALRIASTEDYVVAGVEAEIGSKKRQIIILGERHYKTSRGEADAGKLVVDAFSRVGVESCPTEPGFFNALYSAIDTAWDIPLYFATLLLPEFEFSTIEYATSKADILVFGPKFIKNAFPQSEPSSISGAHDLLSESRLTIHLENGLLSKFDKEFEALDLPYKNVLLDKRNIRMVKNIETYFENFPESTQLLIIVGQMHVPGIIDLLKAKKAGQQ